MSNSLAHCDLAWESPVNFLQNNCCFVLDLHDYNIRRRSTPTCSSFYILLKSHILLPFPIKLFNMLWLFPERMYSTCIINLLNYISRFLWSVFCMNSFDSPKNSLNLLDSDSCQNRVHKHCLTSPKNMSVFLTYILRSKKSMMTFMVSVRSDCCMVNLTIKLFYILFCIFLSYHNLSNPQVV